MNRVEAMQRLKGYAADLRARGATALYLFGSTARDEARADSDLDLFLEYEHGQGFSLVDLVGIKNLLQDRLGIEVDVTTRDSLHPALRRDIEKAALRVF